MKLAGSLLDLKGRVSTTHHYLLLATVASAYNLAGDQRFTRELYAWTQIDAMLIVIAALAFLLFIKKNDEQPEHGSPLHFIIMAFVGISLLSGVAQDFAREAHRLFPGGFTPLVLGCLLSTVAYDLYARMSSMLAATDGGGDGSYLFLTASDVFFMVATGVIRLRAPEELDPWVVPRCYAFMAFSRSLIEWYLSRRVLKDS